MMKKLMTVLLAAAMTASAMGVPSRQAGFHQWFPNTNTRTGCPPVRVFFFCRDRIFTQSLRFC